MTRGIRMLQGPQRWRDFENTVPGKRLAEKDRMKVVSFISAASPHIITSESVGVNQWHLGFRLGLVQYGRGCRSTRFASCWR